MARHRRLQCHCLPRKGWMAQVAMEPLFVGLNGAFQIPRPLPLLPPTVDKCSALSLSSFKAGLGDQNNPFSAQPKDCPFISIRPLCIPRPSPKLSWPFVMANMDDHKLNMEMARLLQSEFSRPDPTRGRGSRGVSRAGSLGTARGGRLNSTRGQRPHIPTGMPPVSPRRPLC